MLPRKRMVFESGSRQGRLVNAQLAQVQEGARSRFAPVTVVPLTRGMYAPATDRDRALLENIADWRTVPVALTQEPR